MKNLLRFITFFLILTLVLPVFLISAEPNTEDKKDLRGVWVATVLNIDYPSKPTTDPEILKSEALKILDNSKAMGMNAIFLQVRPASDALYKSNIFPWSKYLTGSQGLAPNDGFDPLEFWATEAHNRGMELHAWINPYRITKKNTNDPRHDFASLDPNNPARLHPEWVAKYFDGNLYFDPGIPEVRKLVVDSVLEIIENYDIDGIHFDDYFYPGKDFTDKATYEKYGTAYADINEWRRANVNSLISELSAAIKATSKDVSFGISPSGIWANKRTNPLGSDTQGKQSYYDQFADTRKWVKEGLIGYIAPQIYWNIGYSIADYSKLLSWWGNTVQGTGVDLYIGQAAYRSGNSSPTSPWYGVAEMEKQLKLNAANTVVKGSIFFSYKSFANSPALSATIKTIFEQQDGVAVNIPVNVARPSSSMKTTYSQLYFTGSSNPEKPMYLNGKLLENRSKKGYFGVLVPLAKGQNILTFSQEGSYVTRVIYRETASTAAVKMSTADIPSASAFPQSKEYRSPGEKVTLSCQAPIGSKVTVKLDGIVYDMKPSSTAVNGTGLYPTRYTYVYTMPNYEGAPHSVDLGMPEYTMTYNGITKTRKAPANVGVIMKNSPIYAEVTKPVVYTFQTTNTSDGAAYELYSGMVDNVTAITGSFIRLSTGQWISKNDVTTYTLDTQLSAEITNAQYLTGEKWDTLKLDLSAPTAAIAAFDGKVIKLNISNSYSADLPVLPENSLFTSAIASEADGRTQYTLSLKDNQTIEGYYIEKTANGLSFNFKRPVKAKSGSEPLAGITIMVDPGHGGSDPGAIGPLGTKYAEKSINLNTALKLQAELKKLGATVLMTRSTDKALSLDERLTASRNAKPDMFISFHANSMNDNVDISKIDGFSVYYREKLSQPIAANVLSNTIDTLSRNNKGIHNKNFYVIRGTWTPAMLLESGFVPNPNEFEWLTGENGQAQLAKSVSEAIVKYFTK